MPHGEVFTLAAAGYAYADQQWLAGLIDYEVWKIGGYGALAAVSLLLFASGYALLGGLIAHRVGSAPAIWCATIAVFGAVGFAFIRAQVFAVRLFVGLLWLCLDDYQQKRPRRRVVLVVVLLAVWANLHGSALLGAALASAYFLGRAAVMARRRRRSSALAYGVLAVGALLSTLATPYGIHIFGYYRGLIGNPAVGIADIEWDSPAFPALSFFQFALPLLVCASVVVVGFVKRRRPIWPLLGAVALTGIAAWLAMRNSIWLDIAAAVLVADTAGPWIRAHKPRPKLLAPLTLAVTALALICLNRVATNPATAFESHAPLSAINATASYAAIHPCLTVIADNVSASALLWLRPSLTDRVAFDGEFEVYSQQALISWVDFQVARSPRWLSAARNYNILLGSSANPSLVHRLGQLRGAQALESDGHGIAVVRDGSQPISSGCRHRLPPRRLA